MTIQRLALIGCGLIGGSVALALKRAQAGTHISAYDINPQSLHRALQLGIIHEACTSAEQSIKDAQVVLLAVPVAAVSATFAAIQPYLENHTLITDVGSTKRDIVSAAQHTLGSRIAQFVPAHPIAGKESAGIEHACADLFDGRRTILTPLPENTPFLIQQAKSFWLNTGSVVYELTPHDHDATFAAVSHLPHLLAFAFMNGLNHPHQSNNVFNLAGPGFRDFSRIAASNPTIWRDILLANADQIQQQLIWFDKALSDLREAIAHNDAHYLHRLIEVASSLRSNWSPSQN